MSRMIIGTAAVLVALTSNGVLRAESWSIASDGSSIRLVAWDGEEPDQPAYEELLKQLEETRAELLTTQQRLDAAYETAERFGTEEELEEFRAAGVAAGPSRVHGYVAEGSIQRDLASKSVRFVVQSTPPHAGAASNAPLAVHYASLETPDLFKDGAEVVVEGELSGNGEPVFHATKVLAKCPSKFEAEDAQASF